MTVKIFPYRHHRNPCGFLRSCGIRKTSLRQRLHSTATSFGYFQYIRNGCSSQGSKRKKCSCSRKIYGGTSTGLEFERTASTASVCTLAENGACHTGKMAFQQTARNAIFLFWGHPKPSIIKDCYFFAYSGLILFVFAIIIIMWIYTDGKMQSRLYELGDTPMKYLSVTQTAEKWGISTRRIQILCNGNRIPGAIKIGNQWAIPDNESKPADARIKSGKYIKKADEHGVR